MKFSKKTFVQGKKSMLKQASNEYWDIITIEFEINERGHEWMWE